MVFVDIIGFMAAILTTTAFIPQVLKTWKSKSTKDISLGMFLLFSLGVFLWLVYGILIESLPVIMANFVVFIFASIILFFKLRYK